MTSLGFGGRDAVSAAATFTPNSPSFPRRYTPHAYFCPMAKPDLLYVAAAGNVVALDATTGHELWRRPLKPSQVMSIVRHGSRLVAAAAGELWCLDAATGEVVWHNKLKGLGVGFVAIAGAAPAAHGASGGTQDAALIAGMAASYANITD